jgi:protocatechuate 3,4-dioxygenase beta subunit
MNGKLFVRLVCAPAALILLAAMALAQAPPPAPAPPTEAKATPKPRGAITGRVLGEDGQPLAGIAVSVFSTSNGRNVARTVTTDDEGNFKINDLSAGTYNLSPHVPGFITSQIPLLDPMRENNTPRYRIGEHATLTMTRGGAVTGKVLDSAGQSLVGADVFVMRVRDGAGRAITEAALPTRTGKTDDRGVYRIYGLHAGSYLVYTRGMGEGAFYMEANSPEVPTYYPNATRDTAQEIAITPGMDVQGIDLRHRGDYGHAVSGTIVGAPSGNATGPPPFVVVDMVQATTGSLAATQAFNLRLKSSFALFGVPDGDYEVLAHVPIDNPASRNENNGLVSVPRRVTVKGGDVTGLQLNLTALSSMVGRVTVEKLAQADCPVTRRGLVEEILLTPRRMDKEARRGRFASTAQFTLPDDKGAFTLWDLEAGRYRLHAQLPSEHWYVKALRLMPAKSTATRITPINLAATGIALGGGEKLTGVMMTIAEGAAELRGRVTGQNLPSRLRVHLVPAEKEAADEVLRYAEFVTQSDGAFTFTHLAPGKYWLLARAVPDDESDEKPAKPVAWDADARLKLRREAEAANNAISLTPCQRVPDYMFAFSNTVGK